MAVARTPTPILPSQVPISPVIWPSIKPIGSDWFLASIACTSGSEVTAALAEKQASAESQIVVKVKDPAEAPVSATDADTRWAP